MVWMGVPSSAYYTYSQPDFKSPGPGRLKLLNEQPQLMTPYKMVPRVLDFAHYIVAWSVEPSAFFKHLPCVASSYLNMK